MREIRDVLRLHYENGLSKSRIAPRVGLGVTTVSDYLGRFRESGLNWPLLAEMADSELERRLLPVTRFTLVHERPLPDWAWVHRELRRNGVTLSPVWAEYRAAHPDGLRFTTFCSHYQALELRLPRTMRHRPGSPAGPLPALPAILLHPRPPAVENLYRQRPHTTPSFGACG